MATDRSAATPSRDEPSLETMRSRIYDPALYPSQPNLTGDIRSDAMRLLDEVDRLRELVKRAEYIALHLHSMIDQETWRATGGDDGQGHYEGDYHAVQVADEIRSWTR